MKVAVFSSCTEIIILAVKGKEKHRDSIDGFDDWFKDTGRDITNYDVELTHIGAGDGIQIRPQIRIDTDKAKDINGWFEG